MQQGFLLGTAELQFGIQVAIASANDTITQTLLLDPDNPFAVNDEGTVTAQLLGDLAGYSTMPDFSSFLLMVPSPTGTCICC
jgi:hypothetical protein